MLFYQGSRHVQTDDDFKKSRVKLYESGKIQQELTKEYRK